MQVHYNLRHFSGTGACTYGRLTKSPHGLSIPKPDGFTAEAEELKATLYQNNNQRKLSDKRFRFLCIRDFSALGEGIDHITPTVMASSLT
jgi:hypothetical protein